jgi:hypothetical protein
VSLDDPTISRLLAGTDRMSRVEKDAILDRAVAAASPRRVRWIWLAAPVLAAGIAVIAVAPWRTHSKDGELAPRGDSRPTAALRVTCPTACAPGSKLLFDVYGTTSYRYLAAFAKRSDGTVLWYFPTADVAPGVELASATEKGVLDRGIILGAEHPPGTYRVYGVFSTAPLTRAAIRAAFDPDHLTAGAGTAVVTADFEVRP